MERDSSGAQREGTCLLLRERPGNQESNQGPGLLEAPPFRQLLRKEGEDLVLPARRTQTMEGVPLWGGVPIKNRRKRRLSGSAGGGLKTEGVFPPRRAGASSREQTREEF